MSRLTPDRALAPPKCLDTWLSTMCGAREEAAGWLFGWGTETTAAAGQDAHGVSWFEPQSVRFEQIVPVDASRELDPWRHSGGTSVQAPGGIDGPVEPEEQLGWLF